MESSQRCDWENAMTITVRDITKVKSLQNFKLLAGETGLDRQVTLAGILDHEYVDPTKPLEVGYFEKGSFVISSLLYAKDDKDLLLPAIMDLHKSEIAAFAFKTVIFEDVPQEVLDFANENSLPIFSFNNVFFEDVIFEIMDAVKNDDRMLVIEKNIEKMIEYNLTRREVSVLTKSLSTSFKTNAKVAYVSNCREHRGARQDQILTRFYSNKKLSGKAALYRFKSDLIIIISMTEMDQDKFEVILKEIMGYCEFDENRIVGLSDFHSSYEGLDYCLREAYYASIVGAIEEKKEVHYNHLGTYQMLIPNKNSDELVSFMFRYMEPILDQEEHLKTAIHYVLSGGDVNETADRLICHKNTVRYRVNRLHEILDPDSTDMVFYENLSTAIKIYLLKNR